MEFDWQLASVACAVAALVGLLIRQIRYSAQLPPGPFLPVTRNLFLELGANTDKMLEYRKYGPVCSLRFLNVVAIMLNSQEAIRSLFVEHGERTSHRWQTRYVHPKLDFHGGVISAEGAIWREHRTFILSSLRKFGLTRYEEPIQAELRKLIDLVGQRFASRGEAWDPTTMLTRTTASVINKMVYGESCELEDERLAHLVRHTIDFLSDVEFQGSIMLELLGPAAFYVPGDLLHANRQRRNLDQIVAFMDSHIEQRLRKLQDAKELAGCHSDADAQDEAECLLDAYLRERARREAQDADDSSFSLLQIRTVLFDLLLAGMDTTATTLRWGVLLLAHFTDVQRRMQSEIDEVLEGRLPGLADRTRLVYCEAVLHEVERFATIVPLGLPHKACETFEFRGWRVPRNCMLLANIYACHRDAQRWPDPHHFNPANFFDESTQSLRNLDSLIPFSVGRRSCLGETLARQELWLFFVGLLQAFEFAPPPDEPLPNYMQSVVTLIRSPLRFRVAVKARR